MDKIVIRQRHVVTQQSQIVSLKTISLTNIATMLENRMTSSTYMAAMLANRMASSTYIATM
jgi:hypothetical protein